MTQCPSTDIRRRCIIPPALATSGVDRRASNQNLTDTRYKDFGPRARRTIFSQGEADMRSRSIGRGLAVLGALMWASAAPAQSDFPNHTIKIVVPTPPGASLDTLPRLIANRLSQRWNVPVIIENMPGAAQN